MSFTGVLRPGHIQIRVTNLAGAIRHYSEVIGLDEVLEANEIHPRRAGLTQDHAVMVELVPCLEMNGVDMDRWNLHLGE